jgi:hypothetical protein
MYEMEGPHSARLHNCVDHSTQPALPSPSPACEHHLKLRFPGTFGSEVTLGSRPTHLR